MLTGATIVARNLEEPNLTRMAYEKIRGAIVYGPLDLGEPLSENAIAKALNMSKAPVRAAMSELRLKGLVEVVPQSGTYVFSPTRQDIEDLCDFRFLLEGQALEASVRHHAPALLAAMEVTVAAMKEADADDQAETRHLDSEYHHLFVKFCANRYLADAYETIGHRVEALRYRFMRTMMFRQKALVEHAELVDLISAGRVAKAVSVLGDHIARTKQFHLGVNWSQGRSRRSDYKFREHAGLFRDAAESKERNALA
jgi:DNA-binding GntR family transcriptional regulator